MMNWRDNSLDCHSRLRGYDSTAKQGLVAAGLKVDATIKGCSLGARLLVSNCLFALRQTKPPSHFGQWLALASLSRSSAFIKKLVQSLVLARHLYFAFRVITATYVKGLQIRHSGQHELLPVGRLQKQILSTGLFQQVAQRL
jgi:hypothetical protein